MTAPLDVTLYRKSQCGLCDQAEAMLSRIGRRVPLRLELIDIDSDATLQAKYFLEVPVVAVGDVEVARAPLSERTLEATLREVASGPLAH